MTTTMPTAELILQLMRHEGFSPVPYLCTAGACTIGYGTNLDAHPRHIPFEDVRAAVMAGRLSGAGLYGTLRRRGMCWTREEAEAALREEALDCMARLAARCPVYVALRDGGDIVRAEGLVNMAFNLGVDGLLKFKNTLALMDRARQGLTDWSEVRDALRRSLWWGQVGRRSRELGEQFVTGAYVGA